MIIGSSVEISVYDSLSKSLMNQLYFLACDSVNVSIWVSVRISVMDSVSDSISDSVYELAEDSINNIENEYR